MFELTAPDVVATVSESDGARLASLVVGGRELLVTGTSASDPLLWGAYPMVPWAGRVRAGVFRFDGHEWQLPLNLGDHAIHGTAFGRAWTVRSDGSLTIDLGPTWPFGGHAVQRFELTDSHLSCTLEVHAGDRPMPAQAGWHPWFLKPARLDFRAASMYVKDAEGIPTGERVPAPAVGPFDDCFTGVAAPPRLEWEGGPVLTIESGCDHWVLYDEPEHATCVEPQTGPPDGFTLAPEIVEPGRPLVASMTLHWS
jgi:aldose 1-epimerase